MRIRRTAPVRGSRMELLQDGVGRLAARMDGYWWPTIVDCHYNLLQYGHPVRRIGIDPACAAESYTRRVAESLIGDRPFDDGYYSGPNSWTNCSSRAERMVPDTGQTFQQRCLAVIAPPQKTRTPRKTLSSKPLSTVWNPPTI